MDIYAGAWVNIAPLSSRHLPLAPILLAPLLHPAEVRLVI
jgi:hypothetical protein